MEYTDQYDEIIQDAVNHHIPEVDWNLFKAMLITESQLDPSAISPVGAEGIAQFMPVTWTEQTQGTIYEGMPRTDPIASIYTAAKYLRWLLDEWSWPRPHIDRWLLAVASYNSGLGDLLKAQKESGDKSLYREIVPHLRTVDPKGAEETIAHGPKMLNYWIGLIT